MAEQFAVDSTDDCSKVATEFYSYLFQEITKSRIIHNDTGYLKQCYFDAVHFSEIGCFGLKESFEA